MIRIIEMNKIVDTSIITNGKYNINLNLNAEYLLEFIAEDHHVKRIAFNTEIPSNKKNTLFRFKNQFTREIYLATI